MFVTFVAIVLAFAVGLTAVGSVAFFMAGRYDVAPVCFWVAVFMWFLQMVMDNEMDEPIFLAGDLFLAGFCFVMALTGDEESV